MVIDRRVDPSLLQSVPTYTAMSDNCGDKCLDKWTFCAAVNKNGKKHKHQIMELIKCCRDFSMDPQSPPQVIRLQR